MKLKTLQWINTISLAVTIIINALANLIPIGIGNTGAISKKYSNLFTPAPLTFGIWGVIYLMMAIFLLYQWGVIGKKESSRQDTWQIGLWFASSCLINIGWIFAWHFDVIWLSLLLIIGLLLNLIQLSSLSHQNDHSFISYFATCAGFDLYLGWIIAATIANVSVFLVRLKWNGFGISPVIWTSLVLVVGAIIGSASVIAAGKWFTGLAIIWAYIGILIRHIGQNGFAGKYPAIIIFTIVGIVVILTSALLKMLSRNRYTTEEYTVIMD